MFAEFVKKEKKFVVLILASFHVTVNITLFHFLKFGISKARFGFLDFFNLATPVCHC